MSEDGFDFRSPPRREARRFEPPPWEREAFEQMAREQAERDAAADEARARVLAEEEAARAAEAAPAVPGPDAEESGAGTAPESPAESGPAAVVLAQQRKGEVDEKQVEMLLMGLRAEEPAALEGVWLIYLIAGCLVGLVGVASLIWGGAALARPGLPAAGTLGGLILLGFGLGFLGIGGWLVYKALLQRGVL